MAWLDTIIQGILLGGLYALFAAGLSLVFGIMRLVNLAHGDLIVLAAFLILVLVSALGLNPFMAALVAIAADVRNRLGAAILPAHRTLGHRYPAAAGSSPSACRSSSRTDCSKGLAPTAGVSRSADWSSASVALGPINVGVMPLLTLASAIAVIVG